MQSVTLGGKDITDRVFDLQADATITGRDLHRSAVEGLRHRDRRAGFHERDRGRARVSGRSSRSGLATARLRVTLKSALTTRGGVYTINHLPPGDYYAIAIGAADIDGWKDPATLEALATQATRLTVAAGDTL